MPDRHAPTFAYAGLTSRSRLPALWGVPISAVAIIVLAFGPLLVAAILLGVSMASVDVEDWRFGLAFMLVFSTLTTGAVIGWSIWVERRAPATLGLPAPRAWRALAVWAACGMLWSAVLTAVLALLDGAPGEALQDAVTFAADPVASLIAFAVTAPLLLIAAASEEVFFRGWGLSVLTPRLGRNWAVVITSVLFAMAHIYPSEWGEPAKLISLAAYALAGAGFAVIALKQQHLYGAIAFHAGFNLLIMLQSYGVAGFDPQAMHDEFMESDLGLGDVQLAAAWLLLEAALLLFLLRRTFSNAATSVTTHDRVGK